MKGKVKNEWMVKTRESEREKRGREKIEEGED